MITDSYYYVSSNDKSQYFFESDGIQGKIIKVVIFSEIKENIWNLGFGDWHDGKADDQIISNNQDLVKVISTVAQIATDYLELFPQRVLEINPVDDKRKNLYNHVFRRHFAAIKTTFLVKGIINGIKEDYSNENNYDSFQLMRKFEL